MLILLAEPLAAVQSHAEEAFPRECCGLLLGRVLDGPGTPAARREAVRALRARNLVTERAHDRYEMDPRDRLGAEREAQATGLEVIGFYHSHPEHDAYFSQTDLERSEEYQFGEPWLPPSYSYLVVSVREGRVVDRKAFQVVGGRSEEQPIQVADRP